jgi:hypothetical protein
MDAAFGAADFEKLSAAIRRDLNAVLGTGGQLAISRVADIPPSASGKFLYVRNLHRAR